MAARVISATLQGGAALKRHLAEISSTVGPGASVQVGFLEDATYPSNYSLRIKFRPSPKRSTSSVAQVAFWNEFGTSRSPPRPFFRNMIASKSPRWGNALGAALRRTEYDSEQAMRIMGEGIQGQLVESIEAFKDPKNAPFTVQVKGFNKPLIDEGIMLRSTDFQVLSGSDSNGA